MFVTLGLHNYFFALCTCDEVDDIVRVKKRGGSDKKYVVMKEVASCADQNFVVTHTLRH